uniref:Histone-lysine N-methyltransferase SUVR5 n=1 Tax=Cajanus cajan TaxID=3821 RepID=A0A151RSJ6_CAJCA|nr:Histone-lysine N-methyltransferase SUVR5 [Cajanus cajan]
MEVLPCSGVQYAGGSDCSQPCSGTTFVNQGEPNFPESTDQAKLEDDRLNDSLKLEGAQIEGQDQMQQTVCELLTNIDCQCGGASCCDCQVEGQKEFYSFHDVEDDEINEPCLAFENSVSIVDTIESELPNDISEVELLFSEPTWLKGDAPVALWVKWRGNWQAGIKCARADWPLSTLKAKPTHGRKKYYVIFFPHTRNYSWADMLLVRSIYEFPQPIAYKTHEAGLKMVKDLTVARRFIMQKLAIGVISIVDQLHPNALLETARDVMVWKELAMETSRCNSYSDFGRMLLKLQNSIVKHYTNADWMQHSSYSWAARCQNANSAESIELLKEELFDSILWKDVNTLWDTPVQSTLGCEWKTWKHDVMKWFSTSPSFSSSEDMQQLTFDGLYQVSLQVGRKRPKLEVRRAETHSSLVETNCSDHPITLETDPGFYRNKDISSTVSVETSTHKYVREVPVATDLPSNLTNKWKEIVVDAADSNMLHCSGMESTHMNEMVGKKIVEPDTKNRQCVAYIEAKGRQCVRWANDGEVYCCAHLSSRLSGSSVKAEKPVSVDTPMCGGTTVHHTKCKHHALPGSSFCKKHRPRAETDETSNLTNSMLKRKLEEKQIGSEVLISKDMVLINAESSFQVEPVPAIDGDSFVERSNLDERPILSGNDQIAMEALRCIGSPPYDNKDPCLEAPNRYFLYCEKHLPSWLRRARNGKSRIISKEVFTKLLRDCCSWKQKVHLHKACELFYRLLKSILSQKSPVSKEVQFLQALTEASKDTSVGEFFTKLVRSEKQRIKLIWEFDDEINVSSLVEGPPLIPSTDNDSYDNENAIKSQWLFRGYACAICLDSFTNKKLLEIHVQERHHVQFVEQCLLLQCIPCGSHFGNMEQLWLHVLSVHPAEFKPSKAPEQQTLPTCEDSPEKIEQGNSASVENNSDNLGGLRRFVCRFCGLKFNLLPDLGRHHQASHMGRKLVSSCSTKRGVRHYTHRLKSGRLSRPRFKNVSLKASLEEKYGILPERLYLKAAKLCSDNNILVNWHQDGFICPRGCKVLKDQRHLSPLASLSNGFLKPNSVILSDPASDELEVDEFHYIIDSYHLKVGSLEKATVLHGSNEEDINLSMPWESFTYVTKPMLDQSLGLDSESLQLRCACSFSACYPETCDHVYLFDNDYDDAKDIFGKPMRGRFPYDENGRMILEEGYLVYECNQMCKCYKTCPNRILQNGIRGWAVRAGEAILRGTFVCEYVGEVLDRQEAHNRRKRYGNEHCSYFYDIDDHVNDMSRLIEGQAHYVIDSSKFGNVSRFINNSCSPNLVCYQVLVESMDCERAHIGLYANRDIALGEELTYNYHYEFLPGEGSPCLCGSAKCRGRLY